MFANRISIYISIFRRAKYLWTVYHLEVIIIFNQLYVFYCVGSDYLTAMTTAHAEAGEKACNV